MKHVTLSESAQLDLSFVSRGGRTVLDRRLFRYPYVLARTFSERSSAVQDGPKSVHDRPGDTTATLTHVLVQNSGGPVHDRDDLATKIRLGEHSVVRITYQGATAVHRARPGHLSRERLHITLDPDTRLEYLPEARILFPEAAHQQLTEIELSHSSSMLFTDAFTVFDPTGQGRLPHEFDNTLTIRRDGETVLFDRQHLRDPNPLIFQHYRAFGSMISVTAQPTETLASMAANLSSQLAGIADLYAAASLLPGELGLGLRFAGSDLRSIRAGFELARAILRGR